LQALSVLMAALATGQDIAAGAIHIRAGQLRELIVARSRIAEAREILKDPRSLEELEQADHASEGGAREAVARSD
jgi:hypothetical protein